MKKECDLLQKANDLIRSFYQIIGRKGKDTNWEAIKKATLDVLEEQHKYLHPDNVCKKHGVIFDYINGKPVCPICRKSSI